MTGYCTEDLLMKTINKSLTIKEYAAIVMILLSSGTAYFICFMPV